MLSRTDAISLLKRRQAARKEGNDTLLHKLDRQISAAVSKKEWPEIRSDSASSMKVGGPGSKFEEWSGQYLKAPPPKDWEA
jgi:hypothetical protein